MSAMAEARVVESSSSKNQTEANSGEMQGKVSPFYPLFIDQDRITERSNGRAGEWASVPTNGGFYVLKADCATLSLYPKTKTLNVQGAKNEIIKRKLLSLVPQTVNQMPMQIIKPLVNKMAVNRNKRLKSEKTKERKKHVVLTKLHGSGTKSKQSRNSS